MANLGERLKPGLDITFLMFEPSILQYRLQKDQQMLKEVVDVLLIRSKFSTLTYFGICLPSSGVVSA
jgi:hypothetical protein